MENEKLALNKTDRFDESSSILLPNNNEQSQFSTDNGASYNPNENIKNVRKINHDYIFSNKNHSLTQS